MDFLKKAAFFLFVIFILFLFVWALFIPKKEISHKIAHVIQEQSEKSDIFFKGVTLQEIVNGIKYWEIEAKTSDINKSQKTAVLKESRGTFYDSGRPGLKFISPEILWQMDKKEIYMKTPFGFDAKSEKKAAVLLSSPDKNIFSLPDRYGSGYYFKAQELKWSLKDKLILCRGNILIKKGDIIGSAEILKSDVRLNEVSLGGKPRITITSPQLVTIEAASFRFLNPQNIIYINGGVIIKYQGIQASGESAVYDLDKRKVTLRDKVCLIEGESVLTGETIIYSVADNKFKISGKSKAIIPEKKLGRENL